MGDMLSVILPMYNEEKSIPHLRSMFDRGLDLPPDHDFHIIVVNDGSIDRTLDLAVRWAGENPRVTVVSHPRNLGLGQAILTGFGESIKKGAYCTVTMDADATHPGNIITDLVLAVSRGADIAIASRFVPGGRQVGLSPARRLFSFGARIYLSAAFPLRGVTDYTCGFRAYRTSLLARALSKCSGPFLVFHTFTAMVEILLKTAVLAGKVHEVPLVLRYDLKQGASKMKAVKTIRDYFRLLTLPREKCPLGRGLKIL